MDRLTPIASLLAILLCCCHSTIFAQKSCVDTTFIHHYRFQGTGSNGFTVFSADSSILLGAMLESPQNTLNQINLNKEISLLRVRGNGDTVWSKKLVYPSFAVNLFNIPKSVSISDQNQNYLVCYRNFLTRVDSNGNVLTSKIIRGADTLSIKSIAMAPDGDKILLLENGGWERSVFLVRISSDLSLVKWVKNIESNTEYDHLKIWNIVLNGNQVACIGYHEVYNQIAMILAFDYTSGELMHSKGLPFPNPLRSNIHTYDSGYIVQGAIESGGYGGYGIIKMDTALNIKSVYLFKEFRRYNSVIIAPQRDGGFYRLSNDFLFTQLLHVNKNNNIDFKTNFGLMYFGASISGIAVHESVNNLFFTLTANTVDPGINNLATYIGLYKTNLEGYVGNCNLYDDVVEYASVPWLEVNLVPVRVKDDIINIGDFSIKTEVLPLRIDKLCSAISICNTLKIKGDTSTCTNQLTLTGRRDTQCKLPVKWTVLGNTSITQLKPNDSTVTINFTEPGDYTIEATLMGSCSYIADTIIVHVSQPATFSLGRDTSICEGDSLLLKIEGGYKSVTWQDGSGNLTLSVKQPGLYFVNAEATCGGFLTDSILVTQKTSTIINIGPDRSKCDNDTINLNAPTGFTNYTWTPVYRINSAGSASVILNPIVDTAYFIKAQNANGCFSYDTIQIKVLRSTQVFIGNDTSICAGANLLLNAGDGFTSYQWSNGSVKQNVVVNSSGIFSVKVANTEGCYANDSIKVAVHPLPVISLDKNNKLCFGSSRELNPGNFSKFKWQDGSVNKTFTVSLTGTYYVEVTDANGCKASDTSKISTITPLPSGFLPPDTSICQYGSITVQPSGNFRSYLWNANQATKAVSISRPGTFWLKVKDNNNCEGIDSITVTSKQCASGLFVPSAFTPNNDGKNDQLQAFLFGDIKKFDFKIFNRFGQQVFQTFDPYNSWNGKVKGVDQSSGVFVWSCNYILNGLPEKLEKGTIVLIR